jgi:hypothetical protein
VLFAFFRGLTALEKKSSQTYAEPFGGKVDKPFLICHREERSDVAIHSARPSLRPGFTRRREVREEKVVLRVLRAFACEFFLGETLPAKT